MTKKRDYNTKVRFLVFCRIKNCCSTKSLTFFHPSPLPVRRVVEQGRGSVFLRNFDIVVVMFVIARYLDALDFSTESPGSNSTGGKVFWYKVRNDLLVDPLMVHYSRLSTYVCTMVGTTI